MSQDQILAHHGTKGQEWGKRKYQYEDGSLTPLGRIHYGVGEAREKSKIKIREMKAQAKAEAKVAKAKARAEADIIKAKAQAYKTKKDADEETERQRIKADVENEKNFGKSTTEQTRIEAETRERINKAQLDAAVAQNSSANSSGISKGAKVAIGVLVAAGAGYLLYRGLKGNTVVKSAEEGKKALAKIDKTKPAKNLIEKAEKASAKADPKETAKVMETVSNSAKARTYKFKTNYGKSAKISRFNKAWNQGKSNADGYVNGGTRMLTKTTVEALIKRASKKGIGHSMNHEGMVLIHYGIKGQKKGVRRYQYEDGTLTAAGKLRYMNNGDSNWPTSKDEDTASGRKKNVTGTTTGTTANKTPYNKGNTANNPNPNSKFDQANYLRTLGAASRLYDALIQKGKGTISEDLEKYLNSYKNESGVSNKDVKLAVAGINNSHQDQRKHEEKAKDLRIKSRRMVWDASGTDGGHYVVKDPYQEKSIETKKSDGTDIRIKTKAEGALTKAADATHAPQKAAEVANAAKKLATRVEISAKPFKSVEEAKKKEVDSKVEKAINTSAKAAEVSSKQSENSNKKSKANNDNGMPSNNAKIAEKKVNSILDDTQHTVRNATRAAEKSVNPIEAKVINNVAAALNKAANLPSLKGKTAKDVIKKKKDKLK